MLWGWGLKRGGCRVINDFQMVSYGGEVRHNRVKSDKERVVREGRAQISFSQEGTDAGAGGATLLAIFGSWATKRGSLKTSQMERDQWERRGTYLPKPKPKGQRRRHRGSCATKDFWVVGCEKRLTKMAVH
jgi:hypothetical protein